MISARRRQTTPQPPLLFIVVSVVYRLEVLVTEGINAANCAPVRRSGRSIVTVIKEGWSLYKSKFSACCIVICDYKEIDKEGVPGYD